MSTLAQLIFDVQNSGYSEGHCTSDGSRYTVGHYNTACVRRLLDYLMKQNPELSEEIHQIQLAKVRELIKHRRNQKSPLTQSQSFQLQRAEQYLKDH